MKKTVSGSTKNQLTHAIYTPAIQTQYARGVMEPALRPLPLNAQIDDLNFLRPTSKFFTLDAALYSAGVAGNLQNHAPCMVTGRQRTSQGPTILGDSGGFQVMSKDLILSNKEKAQRFHWQVAHCDINMTLDVPTDTMYAGKSKNYKSFDQCLTATLGNLALYQHLGAANYKFLNVLQGQGLTDTDTWYDTVKHYDFYGYAFAGEAKLSLKYSLWRLLAMMEDGTFYRDEIWFHFLGVADLKSALLMTSIRDALQHRFPSCKIFVSYDTSGPFLQGGRFLTAFDEPQIESGMFSVKSYRIKKIDWLQKASDPFPYSGSKISQHLTKGDIIRRHWDGRIGPDNLGYLMLQNHNVETWVRAIDALHQLVYQSGLTYPQLGQVVSPNLLDAMGAIDEVLLSPSVSEGRKKLLDRSRMWALDHARNKLVIPNKRFYYRNRNPLPLPAHLKTVSHQSPKKRPAKRKAVTLKKVLKQAQIFRTGRRPTDSK